MKKHLLVLLSVLAIVAFATTAFALHEVASQEYTPGLVKAGKTQIDLGGELRIRGESNNNLSDLRDTKDGTDGEFSDHNSKYDQRVRLSLKATVSPNTFGFVELETGDSSDTYTWGSGSSAGTSGAKRGTLAIRQAYISTNLGKVATLKAGHMLLALGNNLFFDHTKFGDDAILFSIPAGDGEVTLINLKFAEGDNHENDDLDGYVAAFGMPIGTSKVSADLTYLRDHAKGGAYEGFYLANLGGRFNGDFSGLKVKADLEVQTGKAKDYLGGDDLKYRGFALMAGVEVPAGPATVRANAAYGSGDKTDTDDKYEGYKNFLSDNQYYTYVYDYKVMTAAGGTHTGINNTWYLNAGVTAKPTTDLSLSGDLYFLRAARRMSEADKLDSKKIGVELDAKAEYQIDSNLVYFVEAGYLWAGDLYKNVVGAHEDPDNPWSARHGLLLKF
jgi:hypothetical protein